MLKKCSFLSVSIAQTLLADLRSEQSGFMGEETKVQFL